MRVIVVVEGTNDIEFLRRISLILRTADHTLPPLAEMEQQGELIFLPFGGGSVAAFTHRLAPLGQPEFHLYDHELPPETEYRRQAAEQVNRRPGCQAVLTSKRSLENYLHPHAIAAAGDIPVAFDDFDSVAENVAKRIHQRGLDDTPWEQLAPRSRKRQANRAKRWLNTRVAERMTSALLDEQDSQGEIPSWLQTIGRLAKRP